MGLIASARMYSWSPSLAAEWRRLLSFIVARAGVDVAVMDEHDPTPLDELWRRADLGCDAHTVPELRPTLDALLLSRFVRATPGDFDVFLERRRAAEAAGYAKLA